MKRAHCRSDRQPPVRAGRSAFSVSILAAAALLSFAFFTLPAFSAPQQPRPKQHISPRQTIVEALSAACRQKAPEFSRFLLAGSRRAFDALPAQKQKTFLKRFSLTSMAGRPRALLDAQNRMVVQCQTPAETVSYRLRPAKVDQNVAFIPVAVSGGESTDFGLVRQPGGWRLFSLDLLVINVPALIKQWEAAQIQANEQVAIVDLFAIAQAIKSYHSTFGEWPNTLGQLGPAPPNEVSPEHAQLLPKEVASGTADGYRFRYRVVPGPHGQIQGFELGAVPEEYGKTGRRSFFLGQQGKLHAADKQGAPATAVDPVIPPPTQPPS